ncbi:unnamed protein product [Lepidochelys kempii]
MVAWFSALSGCTNTHTSAHESSPSFHAGRCPGLLKRGFSTVGFCTNIFLSLSKGDQTAGERCTRDSTGVSSLLLSQKTAHPAIQPFNRCPACVFVVPEAPVVSKLTVSVFAGNKMSFLTQASVTPGLLPL